MPWMHQAWPQLPRLLAKVPANRPNVDGSPVDGSMFHRKSTENHGFTSQIFGVVQLDPDETMMLHDVSWCFHSPPEKSKVAKLYGKSLQLVHAIVIQCSIPMNQMMIILLSREFFNRQLSRCLGIQLIQYYMSKTSINPFTFLFTAYIYIYIYTHIFSVCVNYSETIRYGNPRETILEAFDCSIFFGGCYKPQNTCSGGFPHCGPCGSSHHHMAKQWHRDLGAHQLWRKMMWRQQWRSSDKLPRKSKHIDVGPQKLRASTFFSAMESRLNEQVPPIKFHVSLPSGRGETVAVSHSGTIADLKIAARQSLWQPFLRLAAPDRRHLDPANSLRLSELQERDHCCCCTAAKDSNNRRIVYFVVWWKWWGAPGSAGDSPRVQDQFSKVQQIRGTYAGFAAIVGDGSVVTWGAPDHGGDSSRVQDQFLFM